MYLSKFTYILPLCWWNTFISLIKYISIGSSFHSTTLMSFQIHVPVPVLCQFNGKSLVLLNISEYMFFSPYWKSVQKSLPNVSYFFFFHQFTLHFKKYLHKFNVPWQVRRKQKIIFSCWSLDFVSESSPTIDPKIMNITSICWKS